MPKLLGFTRLLRSGSPGRVNAPSHHTCLAFVALFALSLVGCGGAPKNHYRRSLTRQEACCNQLQDPDARAACLGEIPRVDEPGAETSPTNQETFACVERHFACDPATGRATQASVQEQYDCLQGLDSSRQ